jgi:hypothetical protein
VRSRRQADPSPARHRTVARSARRRLNIAGSDYEGASVRLTFVPGYTTKTITVEVKGNGLDEADGTFYLDLFGNNGNVLITKNRGIGTILNDD